MGFRHLILPAVACLALTVAVAPASAAPERAPLAPQALDGPTLHPSGNDRYIEHGGSGTQGKAVSDPDGLYNYGVDQFGYDGGLYLSDQDGNNGCGNDQDFEDDNNGICGRAAETCPPTSSSDPLTIYLHGKSNQHVLDCTTDTTDTSDWSDWFSF